MSWMTPEQWSAVSALATVASAVAAAIATGAAWWTYQLLSAEGAPKIVVYVMGDRTRPTLILIRIANVGRDVAHDVRFQTARPIPAKAWGLSDDSAVASKEVMNSGPLVDGIQQLGPDDFRDVTWGQFGGIRKSLGSEPVRLTFTYRHGEAVLNGSAVLEADSFVQTDVSTHPPVRIARSLEEISSELGRISALVRDYVHPDDEDLLVEPSGDPAEAK